MAEAGKTQRPPVRRWAGALAALLLACGGGAGRPAPAPKPPREVVLSTEAVDEKVGRESSQSVVAELGLVDDPALAAYVDQLGQRLAHGARQGDFQYHFAIVDQVSPNAFALPGGYIYVSRGLLLLTNSEDELANVLGHEITHVAARHAAARQAVIRGIPGPFAYFAQRYISGYTRDQEREADQRGQELAGAAGFDPSGMASFLKGLEFTERLQLGNSRLPYFYDTHPTTSERVAAASGRARMVGWERTPGIAGTRGEYLHRIEGLVVGDSAAEGVLRGQRFLHPDLDFMLRFPDGWDIVNTHVAVGGTNRDRNAQIVLEGQGPGDDPERAAVEFLQKPENQGLALGALAPLQIGDLAAYRVEGSARSPVGSLPVVISWIAYNGSIYRLTGLSAPGAAYEKLRSAYLAVVRSFRPLAAGLRESIREDRLRIATAGPGESLAALSRRTGNQWDIHTTAVMNDIFASEPLAEGQLVKIAVSVPYHPEPPAR